MEARVSGAAPGSPQVQAREAVAAAAAPAGPEDEGQSSGAPGCSSSSGGGGSVGNTGQEQPHRWVRIGEGGWGRGVNMAPCQCLLSCPCMHGGKGTEVDHLSGPKLTPHFHPYPDQPIAGLSLPVPTAASSPLSCAWAWAAWPPITAARPALRRNGLRTGSSAHCWGSGGHWGCDGMQGQVPQLLALGTMAAFLQETCSLMLERDHMRSGYHSVGLC